MKREDQLSGPETPLDQHGLFDLALLPSPLPFSSPSFYLFCSFSLFFSLLSSLFLPYISIPPSILTSQIPKHTTLLHVLLPPVLQTTE